MSESPNIGYLIKRVQSLLHLRMEEALRPYGLTVSHYSCLFRLSAEPGISSAALARATFVTRQSMNTMLQTLLDRELIERPARAESGRALPVSLSPSGARLLVRVQPIVDEIEQGMLAPLSAAQTAELGTALLGCASGLDTNVVRP